jgi:4-amino-4-deoxychorismate lyase
MKKKDLKTKVTNSRVGNLCLFETIKIENRQLQNIQYHNTRFNSTRWKLFGITKELVLEQEIIIPENLSEGVYKCRIIYSGIIEIIEFEPYVPRKIQSLKLIECNDIDYRYKYADRTKLKSLFNQRKEYDDILIIKNGWVTDSSFSNVVFWDGDQWVTPARPLLKGTARERLIVAGKIHPEDIKVKAINQFHYARLINAMIDLDESSDIRVIG